MVKRIPVQGLTEGAILASLVALFALPARYFPLIAMVSPLVCPLPLTVLAIRHGMRIALLAGAVAAIVGVLIAGPFSGLLIASTFAPLGISMGIAVRRRLSAPMIVLVSGITVVLVMLVNTGLTLAMSGVNPLTATLEQLQQSQDASQRFYERLGFSRQQLAEASEQFKVALAMMPRLLAAMVILGGFMLAWLNYLIARVVLRKVGIVLPALPPMSTWRVPPFALWVYLAVAGGAYVVARVPTMYAAGELVTLNLRVVMQLLFTAQGAIVGWVLMEKYNVPRVARWIFIVLAMTNPVMTLVAFTLGVAEAALSLRRRWMPVSSETTGAS